MALLSQTNLESLDIFKSLHLDQYSKDATIIHDHEILDGILCDRISCVKTPEGFYLSFSTPDERVLNDADYYFDSENNSRQSLDELYRSYGSMSRRYTDETEKWKIFISVKKSRTSNLVNLIFKDKK